MAKSPATVAQKFRAAPVCAWPRALHSIDITSLGADHFRKMRTGLLRGVKLDSKGTQPQLVLLLQPTVTEPEFFALFQSIQLFRRHCSTEAQIPVFELLGTMMWGFVPGMRQTVARAETRALLAAFRFLASTRAKGRNR